MAHVDGTDDGVGYGVRGSTSSGEAGVLGIGSRYGVEGLTDSGIGVIGTGSTGVSGLGSSVTGDGVYGEAKNGVHGVTRSQSDSGVVGENLVGGDSTGNGVTGLCNQSGGSGVWGNNSASGVGVAGSSVSGWGIHGSSQNGQAGLFEGKVQINGELSAGNITGALVSCLNGLNTIGPVSHIGNVQVRGDITTTGDVLLMGGDCAEQFDIGGTQTLTPGTVVVIDREGTLRESQKPYDKKVAGVISGAGGFRPGIVLDKRISAEERATVALVGKVCCKVDAQFAPIEVGDQLTTSPTPGHAMKADNPLRAFGTVIGKALQSLDAGQGLILILVALQ